MPNTFITPTMVARDAAITLANRLIVGNLVNRDKEAIFNGSKVGQTVKVTRPPRVTDASEFDGTTTAEDVTEEEVDLTLEKHFYKRVDITSRQRKLELDEFTRTVLMPRMQGIASSIDKYLISKMGVFKANIAGNAGSRPAAISDITAANKALNDLYLVNSGRIALIDTTVEASLLNLEAFTSSDFGPNLPAAVREAMLGRKYGFDFVPNANLDTFDQGDVAGTIAVNGTTAVGSESIALDGFTNATGTVKAGTVFTIAGDSTRYVVMEDATKAGNAATVSIYPALAQEAADDAVATVETAGFENVVYHPNAISAAIVAPAPLAGGNSVVESYNGISVRVSQDSDITTLSDQMVIDVFVGGQVVDPDGGALFGGA